MTYELGYVPASMSVHLTAGADFIQSLSTVDGSDWPDGTSIDLHIGAVTWPATIDGPDASWNVDKTAVDALIHGSRLKAELTYSDGADVDLTWMTGRVVWHG